LEEVETADAVEENDVVGVELVADSELLFVEL